MIEDEIKNNLRAKVCSMVWYYSKAEYADVVGFYENRTDNKALFDDLRLESRRNVSRTARIVVEAHIAEKPQGEKLKIRDLCRMMSVHDLADCLNELFKIHSSMMCSHRMIAGFHERRLAGCRKLLPKLPQQEQLKSGTAFHQMMKSLMTEERRALWSLLQIKTGAVLSGASERVAELSIPELFEVLALCSKYIQLGEEFSGVPASEYFVAEK